VASVATFGPDAIGGRFGWCHASPGNAFGPEGQDSFGAGGGSREGQEEEREESPSEMCQTKKRPGGRFF
jgi:hypothetical protein